MQCQTIRILLTEFPFSSSKPKHSPYLLSTSLWCLMADEHIVMFPFMAQGHIIPFIALANLILQRHPTYTITIANTPLNIQNLQSSLPPNSRIHLRSLPFSSSDHGLPPNSENTDSLPFHHILSLFYASTSLKPHFLNLISDLTLEHGRTPLCIIADVFFGWTVEMAKALEVFHVAFTTCGGYGTAAYFSLWLNIPHIHTDSPEFHLPGFPENYRLSRSQMSKYLIVATVDDPWTKFFGGLISLSLGSDAMLCNTVEELEVEGLRLLRMNTGLRVWAIGPLLPLHSDSSSGRAVRKSGIELETCVEWLNSHPPTSVVYISFGSQNTISASQMMDLAMGLKSSGTPFIWVIRPPIGCDLNEEFRPEWLPEGFEVETRKMKQGILVRRWGPQLEILSHRSTGAFLSHCGWNSVLESLSRGVPLIGWPLSSEQFYNSKMLEEELEVGVELARGVEDDVGSGEVDRVIRLVMEDGKGKNMKAKAVRFGEIIRAAMRDEAEEQGSSLRAIDDFIATAVRQSARSSGSLALSG